MTDAERARMVDDLLQQAEWAYSDGKVRLQGLLLRAAEVISKESVAAARAEERARAARVARSRARARGFIGPVPRDRDADTATAKKALDDYLAGRQDSRGNPTPAGPKCQKCGGPEHGAREGCPAIMARAPKCPRCAGFGLLGGAVPSTCVYCHGTGRRS